LPTRPVSSASLAVLMALAAASAGAQTHAGATVRAVRVSDAPRIDGRLDDAAWRDAPVAADFVQRDPDEGKPATERTEIRVVFDASNIYVAARLHDREPNAIVRRLSRRDDDADADRVTIYLDPHHDHVTGARFTVTAAGSLSDAVLFNDTFDDGSWDAVWDAAVSIDEQGWSAEMRIPFSQLRFPSADRDAWGINAQRIIQRRNEEDWLQPTPKKENGLVSRMAHLTGITGIAAPRQFEMLPYMMSRGEFIAPAAAGDPFNDGRRAFAGAGIDVKYGLTSDFTLSAAINPDFGQVEVDPAVVNLTAFETFFQERRPFFIEGAQIFGNFGRSGANSFWGFNNWEPTIFYSRRIGRAPQGSASAPFVDRPSASSILGAAKLTGKTRGGWNIGLLDAIAGREYACLSGVERSRIEIEPLTHYVVGRAQREKGRTGYGILATWVDRDLRDGDLRDTLAGRALVLGGDGHVFLDSRRDWVINGNLAGSRVTGSTAAIRRLQESPQRYYQRPDAPRLDPGATSLGGWTGRLTLNRNSGQWIANASLWGVSPGFESGDLGFTTRTGVHGAHVVGLWRKPDPDRFSRYRQLWAAKFWSWNSRRELQADGLFAAGSITFRNYWSFNAHAGLFAGVLDDWQTRGGPTMRSPGGYMVFARLETDSRKRVVLSGGGGVANGRYGGYSHDASFSVEVKPAAAIRISFGPEFNRSHTPAQYVASEPDAAAVPTFGTRYVFSNLDQTTLSMSTRATWVISPRMSFQLYSQPLLATGDYWNFKALALPRTFDFNPLADFGDNPDFNFKSLKVNAVFRWEWRLGSTLYLVWTEQRQDFANPGRFSFGRDTRSLFAARPDDVLMLKVSYWLSR
jgi:uncharacterized protein DUF5916/cellulose/xylan binding protein with CBM9 domain